MNIKDFISSCVISGGHTKLYKVAWNVSANNSETVGHKDLRLGQIVYILVFYNISFSWPLPLDGSQFICLLRDSENDLYIELSTWKVRRSSERIFKFGAA